MLTRPIAWQMSGTRTGGSRISRVLNEATEAGMSEVSHSVVEAIFVHLKYPYLGNQLILRKLESALCSIFTGP